MKCDELETEMWLDYGGEPMPCYPAKDVDEAIAELKAEINRKEGVGKRWFERCMEARAENVRLKRALWLARANKAESEASGWYHSSAYIIKYDGLHNIKGVLYGKGLKRYPDKWMNLWIKIERLCLAKAEEYK